MAVSSDIALAETIREAALAVPGVAGISPGRRYVEATYGPGITIRGIGVSRQHGRIRADVHVVAGVTPLPDLARRLREAIVAALQGATDVPVGAINLYIDDIALGDELTGGGHPG